jgi:hypothetical protein
MFLTLILCLSIYKSVFVIICILTSGGTNEVVDIHHVEGDDDVCTSRLAKRLTLMKLNIKRFLASYSAMTLESRIVVDKVLRQRLNFLIYVLPVQ